MNLISLISLISAHTGNDAINHGFGFYEGVVSYLLLIGAIIGIMVLIKRRNKR